MNRARVLYGALAAVVFVAVPLAATCTAHPRVPAGLDLAQPRTTGRFIIYGDTRGGMPFETILRKTEYDRERAAVAARLFEEKPDFVVHSGDLVGRASSGTQWNEEWDQSMKPLTDAGVPLYMAWGNHEYWADPGEAATHIASRFPHLQGRHWYSIRYDRVLIMVLDSNFGELRDREVAQQDSWLQTTLAAAEADPAITWVVLVFHHAPYTNSAVHKPNAEAQSRFVAPAKQGRKVRATITGHVHNYERFLIDGTHHVVAGGGGAPKTKLNVDSPKFKDEFQGPEMRPFQYCLFRMERDRIEVDVMMLRGDGTWYRGDGFTLD